jgi:hypothetical protein
MDQVKLTGSEEHFIAVGRAKARSQATAIVEHEGKQALLSIDFGLGEPGHERQILQVDHTGTFPLPGVIESNELVSVRPRALPKGEVKVTIRFKPAA